MYGESPRWSNDVRPDATETKHSPARKIVPRGRSFFVPGRVRSHTQTHTMEIRKNKHASIRIWAQNPDHHLYNNNGVWWIHYTAYPTEITKKRIRRSLKTRDLELARERRDAELARLFYQEPSTAA